MPNSNTQTRKYAVYNADGNRIELYEGKGAIGKARRHAARLGEGFSSAVDRGPNRWGEPVAEPVAEPVVDVQAKRKETKLAERKMLVDAGFNPIVPANNLFAIGSISQDNRRGRREKFDRLPTVNDGALIDIAKIIEAEEREDFEVEISKLRMNELGHLHSKNDATYIDAPCESRGFAQMLSRSEVFPSASRAMNFWPNHIMVDTFNNVMAHFDGTSHWSDFDDEGEYQKKMVVSTRKNNHTGGRSVFRAISTKYQTEFDCAKLCRALNDVFIDNGHGDCKVSASYWPAHTQLRVDALWQKDYKTESQNNWEHNPMAEGSVFRFGIRILSADMANCEYVVEAIAYRDGCDNAAIISEEKVKLANRRHVGDVVEIEKMILGSIPKMLELIKPFLESWGYLESARIQDCFLWGRKFTDTYVIDENGDETNELEYSAAENAIQWAVKNGKLGKGVAKKVLLECLLTNFHKEPSQCLDGIVNAITRAAHDSFLDDMSRRRLEMDAGKLVPVLARAVPQSLRL